jgi:hypothetical protein
MVGGVGVYNHTVLDPNHAGPRLGRRRRRLRAAGEGRLMPVRAVMTGAQAKQLAGGVAILVGWAWTCYAAGTWQPTADSGAALAVVLWVVFDVALAGGAPEDDRPAAAVVQPPRGTG